MPSSAMTTSPDSNSGPSKSSSGSSQNSTAKTRERTGSHHASSTCASTSSTSEKAASQDAQDFFARATAMGLNLTRQDYERARAGVSAFLKAQRVDKGDEHVGAGEESASGATAASSGTNPGQDSQRNADRSPAIPLSNPASAKISSHSKLSNRPSGSPMLSFFTAVVQSEGEKPRPRLDEVSASEERRRRREKRKKIKERLEREAAGEGEFSSRHTKKHSQSSTILGESPLTNASSETPGIPSESSFPPSTRLTKIKLLSNDSISGRIGLGLQMAASRDSEDVLQQQEVVSNLQSPAQLSKVAPMILESPGLRRLSQKAHIDMDGRLTLIPTPDKRCVEDLADRDTVEEEEEIFATTNAGADTDDSGVFFSVEAISSKKEWSRSRRRSSTNDTTPPLDLHESLDHLSFLDRVMAQKKSPIRLRREARAREREARTVRGTNDIIVMTATTSSAPQAPISTLQPPPRLNDKGQDNGRSLELQNAKNVRWANDSSSPRRRMTTKEHYDLTFYGIAPHPEAAMPVPTFDDEAEAKRSQNEEGEEEQQTFHLRQRTTSVWMKNHMPASNFGSPIAVREGPIFQQNHSPGVLSLNLDSMADRIEVLGNPAMSAKRGLLFGPSSTDRTPPALSGGLSSLDLAESAFLFSQGPTLARSPAKNVFETFTSSTPPKFVRANTLAAPFTLHQSNNMSNITFGEDKFRGGVEDSPDRVMLMRAHSSGTLEKRLPTHSRLASQVAREADKENLPIDDDNRSKRAPNGWAHRSPMGKYETISPAAIFGMSTSHPRLQMLSGEASDVESLGKMHMEPSKAQPSRVDEINSDEEGDDEREMGASPVFIKHSHHSPNRMQLGRKGLDRNHTRDSSASTSAFEDSPMYLDIHNRTASVVSTLPSSSSSLANALGMNHVEQTEESSSSQNNVDQSQLKTVKAKKKKKKSQQGVDQGEPVMQSDNNVNRGDFAPPLSQGLMAGPLNNDATALLGRMEWDKSDGSRVVKLISEELQAALESGTLTAEPPARYYKLPPGWGRSNGKPQSVSYAGMIGQAILSSSDGRLSLNEVYNWISTVFPFFERGDRGWQNSIRHNLSLNKSFIKVERDASIPGKGGWWAIKDGHENRFRGGSYIAPGSAISQKLGKDGNPKTPKNQVLGLESMGVEADLSGGKHEDAGDDLSASTSRRKRQESDKSEAVSEQASDSDYLPQGSGQNQGKQSKKSKKVKLVGGLSNKGSRSQAATPSSSQSTFAQVTHQAPPSQSQNMTSTKVPLRPVQSSSPRDAPFDTITPSRPHHFTASSGHGSASTTSMMANMPMLTDASSPPSSPNNFDSLMPPPSGGVQGAASSQSARKRKQAVNRAVELMNGSLHLTNQQNNVFGNQMHQFTSNYNHLSSHTLQASPLAHMRGNNSGAVNGATFANNPRLRAGQGHSLINAMDSPLRRHSNGNGTNSNNSPSRLFVHSPISSVRGSAGNQDSLMSMERTTSAGQERDESGRGLTKSPNSKMMASPLRGSPLRSGVSQFSQQNSNLFSSPAGMHLQMALGQQTTSTNNSNPNSNPNGASQFLNFGAGNTPNRYTDQNNGNFIYQRWGLSPSPTKSLRFPLNNALYSQNGTPTHNSHLQAVSGNSSNLDDPFDYSGNLQHELEMASELSQLTTNGIESTTDSPMKMGYSNIVRNQHFFNGQMQSLPQQQQQQINSSNQSQQQQPQHPQHHGNQQFGLTPSYAMNLAASNMFATPSYKSANGTTND